MPHAPRRRSAGVVALAVVCSGPGCSARPDSNGLVEDLPLRETTLVVDLGELDHPVLAFSRIADVAQDGDGNLHVLQPMEGTDVVLRPDGEIVRRIGAEGQGPGRLVGPGGLGWAADTLWIVDVGGGKVSYFLDGQYVRMHAYGRLPPPGDRGVSVHMPFGRRFVGVGTPETRTPDRPPSGATLYVLDETGVSHGAIELRHDVPTHVLLGTTHISTLFHDMPLFEVDRRGDRLVVVERPFPEGPASEILIFAVTPSGDTLFSSALRGRAVPLTDEHWDARVGVLRANITRMSFDWEDYLDGVPRPAALGPASSIMVDSERWAWVAREEIPSAATREWIAIDERGTPRFRVSLPAGFRLQDASINRLWGVALDDLDVPHVQGYAFRR